MRRILSGLALALVAITTVAAHPADGATQQQQDRHYMVRLGFRGMDLYHGYIQVMHADGRFTVTKPLRLALKSCTTDYCRRHKPQHRAWLLATYDKRRAAWNRLADVMPYCDDTVTDECVLITMPGISAHRVIILKGVRYAYGLS